MASPNIRLPPTVVSPTQLISPQTFKSSPICTDFPTPIPPWVIIEPEVGVVEFAVSSTLMKLFIPLG